MPITRVSQAAVVTQWPTHVSRIAKMRKIARVSFRDFVAAIFTITAIVALGCDDSTGPAAPTTGAIRVVISTTGSSVNFGGYTLSIDAGTAQAVPVNTGVLGVTIPNVAPGSHLVRLDGLASNCSVVGTNPRSVNVVAGAVSFTVSFSVICTVPRGSIKVSTVTTGPSPDADGYLVTVAGIGGSVPANGTLTIGGVPVGRSEVVLSGVSVNCTVDGSKSRSVEVTFGDTADVGFTIRCVAAGGLLVTTRTSGVNIDPDGYILDVRTAGGSSSRVTTAANATVTVPALPGDLLLTVLEIKPNCDLAGPNPRTVTVASVSEIPVALDVTCVEPNQIAFETSSLPTLDRPEIYAVNSNGSGLSRLTTEPGKDMDAAWSPDGNRLAFASDRNGNLEIYVMNRDGTSPVRLTSAVGADYRPSWSPDGGKIAFVSERDGNPEIYVMNTDGTNPVRLTSRDGYDIDPTWSPDGSRIAFATDRDGNGGIWAMNADGSGVSRLTSNVLRDRQPAWSPDGTRIVFSREVSSTRDAIFIVKSDGSIVTRVTEDFDIAADPAWSPDGRKIAFAGLISYDFYYSYQTELNIVSIDGIPYSSSLPRSFPASNPAWRPR